MTDESTAEAEIGLLPFALMEYERRGWGMPEVHVRVYDWLERTEGKRIRVLRVFRGCGKSTMLGVRNAHKYLQAPGHQLLVQGADDDLAYDISRDTVAVLSGHPLTEGMVREPAAVKQWWTNEGWERTRRTPSCRARGILSRVTGNRADEIQNDDVEVEKNVSDPKARKKLRKKLSEQTHIMKPEGSRLYVGTPHAHDSLYDELIAAGADHLTIPLFATQTRYKDTDRLTRYAIGARPDADGVWVFLGIGSLARLGEEGIDYRIEGKEVVFSAPPGVMIDICTGNAWPERFHRDEMRERRKECRTLNEWDSQYQLQARPIDEMRLDPERMPEYSIEPEIRRNNGESTMWLGNVQIVGLTMRWDPSSGKVDSDVSAGALMLMDAHGRRYWHRALAFTGDVAVFDPIDDKTIVGGQVHQIAQFVRQFNIPGMSVETNGIGGFSVAVLQAALKQAKVRCGVTEVKAVTNKNRRILEAFEGPLSSGMLWAHTSVLDGPVYDQMRGWNAAVETQADDYLDAGAGAITDAPERVRSIANDAGDKFKTLNGGGTEDWRPSAGVFEVEVTH